jgi:AcrR family transcriptional regulator
LLEAAERVFSRRGFHAATVEEIADDAGFSTGALYSNFAGKEELFLALFDEHTDRRIRDVENIAAAGTSRDARTRQAALRFQAFTEEEPDWPLLFYEFWAYAVRHPRLRKRWAQGRRRLRSAIADALQEAALAQGVALPLPAEHLAIAANALANGAATERLADPDAVPDDLFPDVLALLFRGVEAAARERSQAGG